MSTRLSVLDRSSTRAGESPAESLRATRRFARQIEDLGYHRFWVSEHHSVPGVAGTSPTVLAAAIAAATSTIRVGTAGVMLPNHQPLLVAEQFGTLESLYPGRIDMGIGRSLGFTTGVRQALGRGKESADTFPARLKELLGYFTGTQTTHPGVHAIPAEGHHVPPYLLATNKGADLAAELGLPLVIGGPAMHEAATRYRTHFRPSQWATTPYVIASVAVAVADTPEEAKSLLLPEAWSTAHSRTKGVFPPLLPPEQIEALNLTPKEQSHLAQALTGQIHGTPPQAQEALTTLIHTTTANELLITLSTHNRPAQLTSYTHLSTLTL